MQKHYKFISLIALVVFRIGLVQAQTPVTILDETFLTQDSFNTFTPVSVTGTQGWYFRDIYGALCSGYAGGQSFENEDWLISPVMNLSEVSNVQLNFEHTRGNAAVMNVGVEQGWYKAFATANYTGDPETTDWVELEGLNQSIPSAWQYIQSGNLTVPDAVRSETSRIAFRYMSSATQSATWEIKNVRVTGLGEYVNPGGSGVFKITNWNVEWFGCTDFGPDNEEQQMANVVTAMQSMNSDIYCIQEISTTAANNTLETLISLLGSEQWGGSIVPAITGDCNQRQAIIYKRSKVQFVSAGQLTSQANNYYYNWSGGRYPALYNVNLIAGSNVVPVSLVNIHAKAEDGQATSYTRRQGGSEGLKAILDGTAYNTRNLIVIGDFNDYLVGTTSTACQCTVSPYDNFMTDGDYTAVTDDIIDADTRYGQRPIIEHIILSNELTANYVVNSAAQEVSMPRIINRYYNTTSGHLPVSARFEFATMTAPDYTAKQWTVYPNPVTNVLNINGTDSLDKTAVQIFDLTGREVISQRLTNNAVNVSALPAGVYIIKIENRSAKFIKQ